MRVEDAIEQTRSSKLRNWPVADKGYFLGILNRKILERAFVDGRREQPLATIVETFHVLHLHTDHALHLALDRLSKYHLDALPVVNRADIHKLEGVITLSAVLDAYGIDRNGSPEPQ